MSMDRTPAHLVDMLGFTQELQALASGLSCAEFVSQRILCLAVEKLFINLGEAAVRVGADSSLYPGIPWRRIIGLRNILAHGYEQVAHEILYQTIVQELPAVNASLGEALQSLGQ
ncbi:HepT-like ribonuclease domain-containing protein [Limnohabitans radicicola]|uniref:DUF86 domain-containing protein n=1 Tax=Limnohabitans radicicola TaxID=2771427 RepID=A0A927IKI6_9BURK|nr:DUF86 domain-containing protein [Limnohabitans radicicola]MBD8049673.1 DUF86 domain-containing protein [Limnohabitans radicicola]